MGHDDDYKAPDVWFYPNHVGKLLLFGLLGGAPFFVYWAYLSWRAYTANVGYSRRKFWLEVRAATGYRPSALWRALLLQGYLVCLFWSVDRECRTRGVRPVPVPALLALAFALLGVASEQATNLVERSLLSPLWALVPVQLAVNRLQKAGGQRVRVTTSAWEVVWVALGMYGTWSLLGKG